MIPSRKVYVFDFYTNRRLGRDYDYRYGSRGREKGRPGHMFRLRLFCFMGIAVFLTLGLWPLANILRGIGSMSAEAGLAIFGVCAALAGLLFLGMRRSGKMYNELCEALDGASPKRGRFVKGKQTR